MRWMIVLLASTTAHAEPAATDDTGYVFAATQLGLGAPLGLEKERWMPYAGIAAVVRFPEGPARTTYQIPGTPPAFQFPSPPSTY